MENASKRLNIVLVTNRQPHHKYWASSLYEKYRVVAILHPGLSYGIRPKQLLRYGYGFLALKILSKCYQQLSKYSIKKRMTACENVFFGQYEEKYDKIPAEIIHEIDTVNDRDIVQLVKDLDTDIICFLGGDIAKNEFIRSAKMASLNFHSGLSPIYNGMATVHWAVSDFRPNLVGGTLMYITERIDGGPIISHYLPPIGEDDDSSTLFMKNIMGAVELYDRALDAFSNGKKPRGIRQPRSIRHARGLDWTVVQDLRLRYFHKNKMMAKYARKKKIISYLDENTTYADMLEYLLTSI